MAEETMTTEELRAELADKGKNEAEINSIVGSMTTYSQQMSEISEAVEECIQPMIGAQQDMVDFYLQVKELWDSYESSLKNAKSFALDGALHSRHSIPSRGTMRKAMDAGENPLVASVINIYGDGQGAAATNAAKSLGYFASFYDIVRGFGAPLALGNVAAALKHPAVHRFNHWFRDDEIHGWGVAQVMERRGDDKMEGLIVFDGNWVSYIMIPDLQEKLSPGSLDTDAFAMTVLGSPYPVAFFSQMAASSINESVIQKSFAGGISSTGGQIDSALWKEAKERFDLEDAGSKIPTHWAGQTFSQGTYPQALANLQDQLKASGTPEDEALLEQLNALTPTNFRKSLIQLKDAWICIMKQGANFNNVNNTYQDAMRKAFPRDWRNVLKTALPGGKKLSRYDEMLPELLEAGLDVSAVVAGDRQRTIFKEQCFLLSYIGKISSYKKASDDRQGTREHGAAPMAGPGKALPYVEGNDSNASLLVDGDPYGFLNKLIQNKATKAFFNMKSDVLNNLQPMIRLFKVEYDRNHNPYETEFQFDSDSSQIVDALKSRVTRGAGVGIKSFDFTYDGSNPFSVKKSIKAQLKIFANSMDELLVQRPSPAWEGETISYADLALKTRQPTQSNDSCAEDPNTRRTALQRANLDKLTFRLKAVIGWAPPNGHGPWDQLSYLSQDEQDSRTALLNGIYGSYTTLNLTPTVHDFEFDEMGRVTFTINYLAYVEDYYDTPAYNIFAGLGITKNQIRRNLQLEWYSRNCKSEEVNTVRDNLATEANGDKTAALASLINNLRDEEKIYYIRLPFSEVNNFNSKGPLYNWDASAGAAGSVTVLNDASNAEHMATEMNAAFSTYDWDNQSGGDAGSQKVFQSSLLAATPEMYNVSFFYVSDLIDSVLENIGGELAALPTELASELGGLGDITECQKTTEMDKASRALMNFKKLRILLGPVELVNQGHTNDGELGGPSVFVNFGDIPISVRFFIEWLTAQMLAKDRTVYTLTAFLNDLFNKLIRDFLNDGTCFDWDIKQRVRVNQSVLTSYPSGGVQDEITQFLLPRNKRRANLNNLRQPVLNISGPSSADDDPHSSRPYTPTPISSMGVGEEINYFVYFAGRTAPAELMKGRKSEDEERGIFHYMLGRDRGLIKTINLTKTDSTGLAEVRFEQDGYDGLTQLRVVYDVEIDSFADVKTYPGTYIFVDPRGFAPGTNLEDGNAFNLTRYGIGGYFMIVRSTHTFGPGQAGSKIYAKWVNSLEATAQAQVESEADNGGSTSPSRCSSTLSTRSEAASESELNEP